MPEENKYAQAKAREIVEMMSTTLVAFEHMMEILNHQHKQMIKCLDLNPTDCKNLLKMQFILKSTLDHANKRILDPEGPVSKCTNILDKFSDSLGGKRD